MNALCQSMDTSVQKTVPKSQFVWTETAKIHKNPETGRQAVVIVGTIYVVSFH